MALDYFLIGKSLLSVLLTVDLCYIARREGFCLARLVGVSSLTFLAVSKADRELTLDFSAEVGHTSSF